MGAFQNIGIKDYFKRYGVLNSIKRGLFTVNPLHIVTDYENKKILYYRKVRRWIENKYSYAAAVEPIGLEFGNLSPGNPLWIYWNQGEENAPLIVKRCIESIRCYYKDSVIMLSDKNLYKYIKLPQFIEQKWDKGILSAAAYSDVIRFSLLEHYGGTWIDATVLLTGPLPEYVMNSDLFAFRDSSGLIYNPALFPTWLLHCRKSNQIMRETRNILYEYWRKEKHVIEYLFTCIIFTIVLENNRDILEQIPCVHSGCTGLLLNELENNFSEEKLNYITALTSVHKLTYKLKDTVTSEKGTFYEYILGQDFGNKKPYILGKDSGI